MAGSCECCDEPSGSVKRGEFLDFSFSGRPLLRVVSCLLFLRSLKAVIILFFTFGWYVSIRNVGISVGVCFCRQRRDIVFSVVIS